MGATDGLPKRGCDDAEVMRVWRECGLPEYFLGNGGTNEKLVQFADRFASPAKPGAYVSEAECLHRMWLAWNYGHAGAHLGAPWDVNPYPAPGLTATPTPTVCTICGASPAEGHVCRGRT